MIIYYKNRFETPLEALNRLRVEHPEFAKDTLSYAGRLDPMAEGVLLILVGEEENRNREEYLHLPKVYELDILFGIETDSYDQLGLIQNIKNVDGGIKSKAENELMKFVGSHEFPYPPFSSKVLSGATNAKRVMSINKIEINGWEEVSGARLKELTNEACDRVTGDLRQDKIRESWQQVTDNQTFPVLKVTISCESGSYMRTVAHELGKGLGCGALAYKIKRLAIGDYTC